MDPLRDFMLLLYFETTDELEVVELMREQFGEKGFFRGHQTVEKLGFKAVHSTCYGRDPCQKAHSFLLYVGEEPQERTNCSALEFFQLTDLCKE